MPRKGTSLPTRKDRKAIREEVEWAFHHKGGGRWLASLADDPKTLPLFISLLNKVIPAAVDISANVNVIDLGLALEQASKRMLDVSPNTETPTTIEHVPSATPDTSDTREPDTPDTSDTREPDTPDTPDTSDTYEPDTHEPDTHEPDTLEGESFEVLG